MSGFNDPFSPAGSDVPAANGGVSPDFWRNLMMFGGNMAAAANARTPQGFLQYGNGFAGPFGAALSQTAQSSMEVPQLRSHLGLNQAQTEDIRSQAASRNIHNKLDLYNLNFNSSVMGGPQFDEQGNVLPPGVQSPYSWGGQQQSQAQPQPQGATGGGVATASNAAITPFIQASAQKYGIPQPLAMALLQQESSLGTDPKGANNIGQVTSGTAANPGLGMQPMSAADSQNPEKNIDFAMQYLRKAGDAAGVKDWSNPSQWPLALHAYNGGGDPNYVQHVARYLPQGVQIAQAGNGPFPTQSGGGQQQAPQQQQIDPRTLLQSIYQRQRSISTLTPQEAGAIAPFLHNINPQLGQELAGYALAGPKAGSVKAAEFPYVGPEAKAKADNSITNDRFGNMYVGTHYLGRGPEVKEVWNPKTQQYEWGDVGGIGVGAHLAGAETGGSSNIPAKPGPTGQEFGHKRGEGLAEQFNEIDEGAQAAIQSNFLFDNMRNDSKSWQMGKFADWEADGRAYLSAAAHSFGIDAPNLDRQLADYTAFGKSSGMLLRSAVKETSSRAAVQEYKLIGDTLPVPTTPERGFGQIADQWQALNDYRMVRQQVAKGYESHPQDFNVDFNSKVSPTSFLLNRMQQTPGGKDDFNYLVSNLQKTSEGKIALQKMSRDYQYAKQQGFFNPPQQAAAPQ